MSYLRKIEYSIIPDESFRIIRNCSGCGCKSEFHNTNCFRVNANGRRIDVWLIFQCIKCKHTNNLTVYERCRPESISPDEYERYLSNSNELAFDYGTDSQFFAKNKAEVDWSNIKYRIDRQAGIVADGTDSGAEEFFCTGDFLVVSNRHALRIRTDKVVAEVLKLTRSRIKGLEKSGIIIVTEEKQDHRIVIEIKGDL